MLYLKCSQKILVSKPMWSLQNLQQLMLRVKPMLDLILIQILQAHPRRMVPDIQLMLLKNRYLIS